MKTPSTVPMLCVRPANANLMRVDVSDDNGKTWRGLGEIPATYATTTYGANGYERQYVTNYQRAEDAFFADLDARNLPYVRCRDHVKCDVNR